MLSSPQEKEGKSEVAPKGTSILEKTRASQREALQNAAEEAASRVAKPERRPEEVPCLKKPAALLKRPARFEMTKAKKPKETPADPPAEARPERSCSPQLEP